MGIAWIKFAQMLAMQNIDGLFDEADRLDLLHICDDINPIPFNIVMKTIEQEYPDYRNLFQKIYKNPIGSASVSQVHKAVLSTGEIVVLKVKRKDIEKSVEHDIQQIYSFVRYFGWIVKLDNSKAVRQALNFYMDWLKQEIDFEHEVQNIQLYKSFVDSVNGKVDGCADIVLPRVYEELCTENCIVMEYIKYPTIAKGDYTKEQQINALSSYIKLSFYALFHDLPIVWHGDPHAGNIYIDDSGNIGFLDMGLLFKLSEQDSRDTLRYFLSAFMQKPNYLYSILEPYMYGKDLEENKKKFQKYIREYCSRIPTRPLSMYFMDLMLVCFDVHICPQDFLFGMAKAFVCLSGFDVFLHNDITGESLLSEQVTEFVALQIKSELADGLESAKSFSKALLDRDSTAICKIAVSQTKHIQDMINFILDKQ